MGPKRESPTQPQGGYRPLFSNALWLEYEDLLARPVWTDQTTADERRQVLAALPDDTAQRLKQLAASRGVSLNKLMEELGTTALAAHDTETRFRAAAAGADRRKALDILARLDEADERNSH